LRSAARATVSCSPRRTTAPASRRRICRGSSSGSSAPTVRALPGAPVSASRSSSTSSPRPAGRSRRAVGRGGGSASAASSQPEHVALRAVDYRILHGIYSVSLHHHWVGSLFHGIEQASIPFMVIVTVVLWLFARPGGDRKWKLAAGSALASAAVSVIANQVIHAIWDRPRPYEDHPTLAHPWSSSTDASFPSDHTSASFAIAFAVLMFD